MKHSNIMYRAAILAASVLVSGSVQANFIGSSSGTFQNPSGPPGMVVSGIGSSTVSFGQIGFGTPASSLSFSGGAFDTPAETSFPLGTLTYYNGTTAAGTEMTDVDLQILLAFTDPSGLNKTFSYPLHITMTINTGNLAGDADFVTLPPFSHTVFTDGGNIYTLEVGFGAFSGSGYLSGNEFHVYEDATATAPLTGKITQDISQVPDGGSTLLLLSGASALVGVLRRKLG